MKKVRPGRSGRGREVLMGKGREVGSGKQGEKGE